MNDTNLVKDSEDFEVWPTFDGTMSSKTIPSLIGTPDAIMMMSMTHLAFTVGMLHAKRHGLPVEQAGQFAKDLLKRSCLSTLNELSSF